MNFVKPLANDALVIQSAAVWPSIVFATDTAGPHRWEWSIQWRHLQTSGVVETPDNAWDAQTAIANLGGTLIVKAISGSDAVSQSVTLKGTNPDVTEVTAYLSTKTGAEGFDKLLRHESNFQHFDAHGEPVQSFDNGYGMCQLTTPVPSFEQIWNWKANIDGGLALFAAKRAAAVAYLSQNNRSYTPDQLAHEAVCRWNGGAYHVWDSVSNRWIRNPNMLCDSATGNIGWDMTDPANKGKTEAQLHQRDRAAYSRPPAAGAHWRYSGVCYADAILG